MCLVPRPTLSQFLADRLSRSASVSRTGQAAICLYVPERSAETHEPIIAQSQRDHLQSNGNWSREEVCSRLVGGTARPEGAEGMHRLLVSWRHNVGHAWRAQDETIQRLRARSLLCREDVLPRSQGRGNTGLGAEEGTGNETTESQASSDEDQSSDDPALALALVPEPSSGHMYLTAQGKWLRCIVMIQPPKGSHEVKIRVMEVGAATAGWEIWVQRGRVMKFDQQRFDNPPSELEAGASHLYLDYSGTWRACAKELQMSPTEVIIRAPGLAGDVTAWRSSNVRRFQASLLNQKCETMMVPNAQVLDEDFVWQYCRVLCRMEPCSRKGAQLLVRLIPWGQVWLVSSHAVRGREDGATGERLSPEEEQRFTGEQGLHPQRGLQVQAQTPLDAAAEALLRMKAPSEAKEALEQ